MLSGSSIIDFAIGMIFFYFLLSTVCSTVNGLIASTLEWGWLQKIFGLRLTALAISLGAPFWFNLLGKVSKFRGSGPAPEVEDSVTEP